MTPPLASLRILAACSGVAAIGLWAKIVADQWPQLILGSALCGARVDKLGHCLTCFAAAGLTALCLAVLAINEKHEPLREDWGQDVHA